MRPRGVKIPIPRWCAEDHVDVDDDADGNGTTDAADDAGGNGDDGGRSKTDDNSSADCYVT